MDLISVPVSMIPASYSSNRKYSNDAFLFFMLMLMGFKFQVSGLKFNISRP
jgi:hypothetical protein